MKLKNVFISTVFLLFYLSAILLASEETQKNVPYSLGRSQYQIYEAYRNNAEYYKALEILDKIIEEDADNDTMYIELGSLYMNGFQDKEKAAIAFENALEANPLNAHAYILLGEIYEKDGRYQKAKEYFKKAVEIKPSLDTIAWAKNNLKALDLIKRKQLIKDWWYIGPFDNTSNVGFDAIFPPEKEIDLNKVYRGKNGLPVSWKRVYDSSVFGFVDLTSIFPVKDNTVGYVLTYVYSTKNRKVQIMVGSDDGIKVWINNNEIFAVNIGRRALADDNTCHAWLKPGWNTILLKVTQTWGGWGLYFRITDLNGNFINDLVYDPLQNNENALQKIKQYRFKTFLKYTGMALIVISLAILLFIIIRVFVERYEVKRLKEDFISSVSHEMKTPITSIKMFSETLLMGRVKDEQKKQDYLHKIVLQSDKLTTYINNILDFSRLESGQMLYDFTLCPVFQTLQDIIDSFLQHYPDTLLNVSIDEKLIHKRFNVDINSFERALLNIIFNAIKYSQSKPVDFHAWLENDTVAIVIQDKGIGIDKKDIKKVFNKFYRTHTSSKTKVKGTGLGLTIVKRILDAHSALIEVDSELGKGSTFTIYVPVEDLQLIHEDEEDA